MASAPDRVPDRQRVILDKQNKTRFIKIKQGAAASDYFVQRHERSGSGCFFMHLIFVNCTHPFE